MLWKQRGFLTSAGNSIQHGQQVKELLDALLLLGEVTLTKVEAKHEDKIRKLKKRSSSTSKQKDLTKVMILAIPPKDKSLERFNEAITKYQSVVSGFEKEGWGKSGCALHIDNL